MPKRNEVSFMGSSLKTCGFHWDDDVETLDSLARFLVRMEV